MVTKLGKVLCCMFLLAILGVNPAQKPGENAKKMVTRAHTTNH